METNFDYVIPFIYQMLAMIEQKENAILVKTKEWNISSDTPCLP